MGMYTGIRLIGIVKKEFREQIQRLMDCGEWSCLDDSLFLEFSLDPRADFIPFGALAYMPDEWENDERFQREYNEVSGLWKFACSLKNYDQTIDRFLQMIPHFMECLEHCEVLYEEWDVGNFYALENGTILSLSDSQS